MAAPTPTRPSHHFTRRTARKAAVHWNVTNPSNQWRAAVVKATRGPYRYRVVIRRLPID